MPPRTHRSLTLALCLLAGLRASAQYHDGQLRLRVVDDEGLAVIGATVEALATDTATLLAPVAVTDAEGYAEFALPKEGFTRGLARVRYLGYETAVTRLAYLGAGPHLPAVVQLRPTAWQLAEAQVVAVRAKPSDPFAFVTLDADAVAEANVGFDVPMLLRRTPGATFTSDAGTGIGYSGIRIRGADATRINVTVNGVPLNDAESQGVFWVNMPDFISSTRSLQVQRGVGESTYGSGAFGANLNLVTDVPNSRARVVGELAGGNFGTGRAMLKAATGQLGNFSAEARLSYITSEGFVDRASARLGGAYLGTSFALSDRRRLQAIAWTGQERTYQAWYGIPRGFLDVESLITYNPAGDRGDGTFYDDQVDNYGQTHAQLLYSEQLRGDWLLQLTGHYTRGLGYYEEWRGGESVADYFPERSGDTLADVVRRLWLDNHFAGGIATVTGGLSPKLDLTYSLGANRYVGDHFGTLVGAAGRAVEGDGGREAPRFYDNDATKDDLNTFAKLTYRPRDGVTLYGDAQLRHVRYGFAGILRGGRSFDGSDELTFFNPKAGVTLRDDSGAELFASVAVGQREPNRNDYEAAANAGDVPRPERLTDYELGFRQNGRNGARTLELTAYYMDYRDQLVPTGRLNDVGEYVRANVDRSYRLGLEVAGATRLGRDFVAEGNLSLARARVRAFTEFVDVWDDGSQVAVEREDTPLGFSPAVIWNLGLRYAPVRPMVGGQLDVALWGTRVSQQYLDNTGSDAARLNAYFRLDLEARYTLQPGGDGRREVVTTLTAQNLLGANPATNGYSYRYRSAGYDPLPDDPYSALEEAGTSQYVLTGYYPQAGLQVLAGLRVALTR